MINIHFLAQIDIFVAQQFLFQRQWQKIRDYAHKKGISIMGDMPIYVGYHSADVWANKKQFLLVGHYLIKDFDLRNYFDKILRPVQLPLTSYTCYDRIGVVFLS